MCMRVQSSNISVVVLLSVLYPLLPRELVKSTQGFQRVPGDQPNSDVVGRPMMHLSALQQATGEARYDDAVIVMYLFS